MIADITPDQMTIYERFSRLVMAWIAYILTGLTTIFFLVLFVFLLFKSEEASIKIVVGLLDGLLVGLLRIVFKHLFPAASGESPR